MSSGQEAATQLDVALGKLLDGPGRPATVDEDELLSTARLLRGVLPVFHPAFGFEERLAGLLAARVPAAASVAGEPVSLRTRLPAGDGPPAVTWSRRGLLARGAIASGVSLAIPVAAAVLLAWRRVRASAGAP
jgi:hypothetical protein